MAETTVTTIAEAIEAAAQKIIERSGVGSE